MSCYVTLDCHWASNRQTGVAEDESLKTPWLSCDWGFVDYGKWRQFGNQRPSKKQEIRCWSIDFICRLLCQNHRPPPLRSGPQCRRIRMKSTPYSFWAEEEDWITLLRGGDELTGGRRRQNKVAVVADWCCEWIEEATEVVSSPLVLQEVLQCLQEVLQWLQEVLQWLQEVLQQDVRCSFQ